MPFGGGSFVHGGLATAAERSPLCWRFCHLGSCDYNSPAWSRTRNGSPLVSKDAGYSRSVQARGRDVAWFIAALVIVPAFVIAIFAAFAPQYLEMFTPLVHRIRPAAG
jgi:hypothetical protein